MTIRDAAKILDAEILCEGDSLDRDLHSACSSDMMSDVLAFTKDQSMLITGLLNPQVVRTAEMMDIICVTFVRGKRPDESIVRLAQDRGISLLASAATMFTASGLLYQQGLSGGGGSH